MTDERSLAIAPTALRDVVSTPDQVDLLRRSLQPEDLTHDEFDVFLFVCQQRSLDPFRRQIVPIKRQGKVAHQVTIDGFRAIAERAGSYQGQTPPQWTNDGITWRDVWIGEEPPLAARVGIYRKGAREPFWGIATRDEYLQTHWDRKSGRKAPSGWWAKNGGAHMLAKCAEALGLRKAFPDDLSGLYTSEEMGSATVVTDGEPGPVVEPERVEEVPDGDQARRMETAFKAHGVTNGELVSLIGGTPLEQAEGWQVESLRNIYRVMVERERETEGGGARFIEGLLAPKPNAPVTGTPPGIKMCESCGAPLPRARRDVMCETCRINEAQKSEEEREAEVAPRGEDEEIEAQAAKELAGDEDAETPWGAAGDGRSKTVEEAFEKAMDARSK